MGLTSEACGDSTGGCLSLSTRCRLIASTIDAFTEPITECLKSVRMSLSSLCETTWGLALFLNKPEERQQKKYIHVWVKNSELLSD